MKHVVALSGGKDSTAMALRLAEVEPRDYVYLCTPTGNELPEMFDHWLNLEGILGRPLVRLTNGTLESWIEYFKALPNNRMRWCTRLLKIEPTIAFLKANAPATQYVGLRADEEERDGIYTTEIPQRFPMREWGWTVDDVLDYLNRRGIKIPERTDCAWCYDQRLYEWRNLWLRQRDIYLRGEAIEEAIGATFRSPTRDSPPPAQGAPERVRAGYRARRRFKEKSIIAYRRRGAARSMSRLPTMKGAEENLTRVRIVVLDVRHARRRRSESNRMREQGPPRLARGRAKAFEPIARPRRSNLRSGQRQDSTLSLSILQRLAYRARFRRRRISAVAIEERKRMIKAKNGGRSSGPLRIEYMDLALLKVWPRNPKDHDLGAIDASFERFGYRMPVAIDERTKKLVAGAGRIDTLAARKKDGREAPEGIEIAKKGEKTIWRVPVVRGMRFADDGELEAYLVADNQPVILGGWNDPLLVELLADLEKHDALGGTGFDADDLERMLKDLAGPSSPDEFPSVDETLPTQYSCPKCHYEWSGEAKPGNAAGGGKS